MSDSRDKASANIGDIINHVLDKIDDAMWDLKERIERLEMIVEDEDVSE